MNALRWNDRALAALTAFDNNERLVHPLQRFHPFLSRRLGEFPHGRRTVSDTLSIVTTGEMLRRIRSEFLEMPGLRLTHKQAQRLWSLDEHTCAQLLDSLAQTKFLRRTDGGMYSRLTEGALAAPLLRVATVRHAGISG